MTEGRRVATHRGVSPERKKRTFQVLEIACLGSSCVSKNLCKKFLRFVHFAVSLTSKNFKLYLSLSVTNFNSSLMHSALHSSGYPYGPSWHGFCLPLQLHHPPLSPCHSKVLLPGASSELHSHSRAFAHARGFCHLSSFPRIIFLIFQVSQLKTPFCGKTLRNPH